MNQLAVSRPWGTGVNEPAPPGHQLPEVGVNEPILSGHASRLIQAAECSLAADGSLSVADTPRF